jgi:hypothetical protein
MSNKTSLLAPIILWRGDGCGFRLIFGEPSVGCVHCSQVPIGL